MSDESHSDGEESISVHSSSEDEDEEIDSEEDENEVDAESDKEGEASLVFEGLKMIVSELTIEELEEITTKEEMADEKEKEVDQKELPNLIYKLSILMLNGDERANFMKFIKDIST